MKKRNASLTALGLALILALVCVVPSAMAATPVNVSVSATFMYDAARSMLDMVNAFRTGGDAWYWNEDNATKTVCSGLQPMQYDFELEQTAMRRALEIAVYFSHTRPNGSAWSDAFPSGKFTKGENIAYGFGSAAEAYTAWREDSQGYSGQGHRRNMLRDKFTRIGIGAVEVGGICYWAQAFGSGKVSAGSPLGVPSTVVDTSWEAAGLQAFRTDATEYSVNVGGVVAAPKIIATTACYGTVQVMDQVWTSANGFVAVNGQEIVGAVAGSDALVWSGAGASLAVPITVIGAGAEIPSWEPSPETPPQTWDYSDDYPVDVTFFGDDFTQTEIEDYNTPLSAGVGHFWLIEDDECFMDED